MIRCFNVMHNTEPLVFHNPMSERDKWDKINKLFFATRSKKIGDIKDATIITWNNEKHRGPLERSLDHLGVPYKVLGKNIRHWRNDCKLDLTKNALDKIETKYVMGFDSCDVLVTSDPHLVVERFANTGLKLLFNAGCGNRELPPIPEISIKFENAKPPFHFLNAGVWIGELDFLKDFFDHCLETMNVVRKLVPKNSARYVFESEQKHIKYTAKTEKFRSFVGIDSECAMFQIVDPRFQKLVEVSDNVKHIKML